MRRVWIHGIVALACVVALALFFVWGSQRKNGKRLESSREAGESVFDPTSTSQTRLSRLHPTLPSAALAGTVRTPSHEPIESAVVCAMLGSGDDSGTWNWDETEAIPCSRTNRHGVFRLDALLPGSYQLHAARRGFVPRSNLSNIDAAIHLRRDERRSGVDLILEPGGVEVSGVVRDLSGGTVAGAQVVGTSGEWGWEVLAISVVRTGADGTFQLWVREGQISLSATAEGYSRAFERANVPSRRLVLFLTPASTLQGRVVERSSQRPVVGIRVDVKNLARDRLRSSTWASAQTDEAGRFRFDRLPPGRYKAFVQSDGMYGEAAESLLLGLVETRDDVIVEVDPFGRMSGRVVAPDGTPCRAGSVLLANAVMPLFEATAQVGPDGAVTFDAVHPGTYRVRVWCAEFRAEDRYDDLVVPKDAQSPFPIWTVRRGARVHGSVRDTGGAFIKGARVFVDMKEAKAVFGGGGGVTDGAGAFVIDGLAGGAYTLSATAAGYVRGESETVNIPEEGSLQKDIVLHRGGKVIGTVVDQDGAPAQVDVRLYGPATPRSPGWPHRVKVSPDGTFLVEGLAAGKYLCFISQAGTGQLLKEGGREITNVKVDEGKTHRVRFVVESQTGHVGGQVLDVRGNPISDAFVASVRSGDDISSIDWSSVRPVLTGTDGRFLIEGLAPGPHTLRAYQRGGGEATVDSVPLGANVQLAIRPTGAIVGRVVAGNKSTPTWFEIRLRGESTGYRRVESFYRTDGKFAMRDLPADTYRIWAGGPAGDAFTSVVVGDGQIADGLEFQCQPRATLVGRVVDDSGNGVAGMQIKVRLETDKQFEIDVHNIRLNLGRHLQSYTDEDGRFRMEHVPSGPVTIATSPDVAWTRAEMKLTLLPGSTKDIGQLLKIRRLNPKGVP